MNTTTQSPDVMADEPAERTALLESRHDMRDALLMASLAGNLFMVSLWLTMQMI